MTAATGRIVGSSRSGNSAMAIPAPMPLGHHAVQHRTIPFGTSWPCASSPPSFPATDLATSTIAVLQRTRGSVGPKIHAPKSVSAYSAPSTSAMFCASFGTATGVANPTVSAAAASSGLTFDNSTGFGTNGNVGGSHRWPAPARSRVRACAVVSAPILSHSPRTAGSVAGGASADPGGSGGTTATASATRPPSPPLGLFISYFDGFCPEGATECSLVWEQLRSCSKWQQMRQVYDNLLRAEAAALTEAQAVEVVHATRDDLARGKSTLGSNTDVSNSSSNNNSSYSGDSSASISMDRMATSGTSSATARNCAPGLLSRDETYAFLLQLQDFFHLQLDQKELEELQAFRCRLVRDLSVYVRRLNAEQLEAMCCASAVSGKCLSRDRADAVQQRLLKILLSTSESGANGNTSYTNGYTNGNGGGSSNEIRRRHQRKLVAGGFQVLTPALNIIFALYDHGYPPQVALLQAVFRQAVDHCGEVTRSQWHGLNGLARRFRFLLDDMWLEDLHAHLREQLSCAATDFGHMASILGCISAFTANKVIEALDTRVLVVVEAIERRCDEGRSLLTAHHLVVFTALLVDIQSPFRAKWLGLCLDHLGSCRSHLSGLAPATLVLAVELVLRGRGWDEQRLLGKLLRQLFATYTRHPAATLRSASSNVSGCPPRAASRIISSSPSPASAPSALPAASTSLSAMAAAASWDVDVGGSGGAASPVLDLAYLVDWLAAKVPLELGPERTDTLEFLQPLVSGLVEDGRSQLASLEPRCLPGLIRSVSVLGVSPSREWVSEAFARVAGGAAELSGSELVAMLRLSHAQRLPLPHVTLDAVCSQYARILPLMRAVDLCRLLECWVADRYIPSREQLEGFFDAVCDAFGIDLAALKAAAAGAGPDNSAARRSQEMPEASFDTDSASLPSTRGGRDAKGKRNQSAASYMELEMLQAAGGAVSAGAADGVAGSFSIGPAAPQSMSTVAGTASASPAPGNLEPLTLSTAALATAAAQQAPPPPLSSSSPSGAAPPPPSAAVTTAALAVTTAAAAATPADADIVGARASGHIKYTIPSLGSIDGRPKGAPLQPSEAESTLLLLEQYRALLLEFKRSDLLVVMNTYRNGVASALHDMRKTKDAPRKPNSSRLLQAVIRGGDVSGDDGAWSGRSNDIVHKA
ncbi:hypothetical protein VaNZ11_009398 [Volvox africanus]|uniref:Uncharacterized protein n=1 Tax=Volvox africanus TaxID=51714 RepID=A0ABQ5S8X3_9CHLO|nr:hypothetical protein VaNZ11_009398 [Volvox africanus]